MTPKHVAARTLFAGTIAALAIAGVTAVWLAYLYRQSDAAASAALPALPQVVVSKPLVREVDSRLAFLGQFSAVEQVELRAQVGGTLTEIYFKDGDIVRKATSSSPSIRAPMKSSWLRRMPNSKPPQRGSRSRIASFPRADLNPFSAGTAQNVDQRTADQRAAQAAVDDANAQIRDAQFDLEHCRIAAPFTGRIGTHLVSVGNLIAGSRAATSPTTLLATLVSLDPIYLDFDMSESDFLALFTRPCAIKEVPADKVEIALSDEARVHAGGQRSISWTMRSIVRAARSTPAPPFQIPTVCSHRGSSPA